MPQTCRNVNKLVCMYQQLRIGMVIVTNNKNVTQSAQFIFSCNFPFSSFPYDKSSQGVNMTTLIHLASRLGMYGLYVLFPK
jgi:hypothetical protein